MTIKKITKAVSVFLAILMLIQILPLTTFAAEKQQEDVRLDYLKDTLSDYLYELIDTDGITEVIEPEPYISQDNNYETELKLKNKSGENVSYIFSEPVAFFDDNGELQYKETNIVEQPDADLEKEGFAFANGTNDYRINFSESLSKGVSVKSGDVTWDMIALPIPNAKASGKVRSEKIDNKDTDVFVYENAFGKDTVLKYYPQLNGVKEDIILKKYTGINAFSFSLHTEDGYAVLNDDRTVTVHKNSTDEVVDTFTPPYAYDSIKKEDGASPALHFVDGEYILEKISDGEYILTIVIPEEFLAADTTVYPVIIDPTTSSIYQSVDTPIYSGYPTSSYSSNATNNFGRASDYGYGRVLTKFTIPTAIKNYATISSAYLWMRETTGRTTTTYVRPYMNTSSFTGSTTWNTKPSYDTNTSMSNKNINSNSQDGGPSVYWYKFDISYAVKKWTTGTTNNGLTFISDAESNGEYYWRAFASAEHGTSSYRPYAVITYTNDTTAPTLTVTGNPTEWTSGAILSVTATDNASGVAAISWDNGSTWVNCSSDLKTFLTNETVYIKAKDKAGNISAATTVKITKVDRTAPTISGITKSPSSWTNGNVTLTVNATDSQSGVASYSFDNGNTWQTGKTKTVSANGTYNIKVKDTVGHIASQPVTVDYIDKAKPTVNSVTGNPTTWTNQNVTLTVSASDPATTAYPSSGITSYSFDNGSTWQTSSSKKFTGNQTVNIKVKDTAGNISAVKTVSITKIDKVAPTISSVSGNPTNWTNQNVTLTVTASDSASGVASYSFDNGSTWQTSNSKTFSSNQTVNIKVKDAAGNISAVKSVSITKIDKTIASTSEITVNGNPTSWTNQNVTLTVIVSDAASGIAGYSFDNGSTWQSTNSKPFSSNQTVNIKVKDTAGNVSAVKTVSITKIDKTAPMISSVSGNPTSWTNQNVTLTVTASDNASGVAAYSFDNGNTWQTTNSNPFSSNQTVNIKVKDHAGNISAVTSISITKIDKANPVISSAAVTDTYIENGSAVVVVTVSATDAASGISQYSFDGGKTWQKENSKKYTEYKNDIIVQVKDNAGNIATHGSVVNNDVTAPAVPFGFVSGDVFEIHQFDSVPVQSPERIEFKFGENGVWQEYVQPVKIICTADTDIYYRSVDAAGNISNGQPITARPNIGVYSSTKNDLNNGEFMLPSGFIRTYNSVDNKWFFAFDANVTGEANGKAVKLVDFYGNAEYYIVSADKPQNYYSTSGNKIVKENGSIVINEETVVYSYIYLYESATVYFGANGKIAAIVEGNQKVKYTWSGNMLTMADNHNRVYTVEYNGSCVSKITDCAGQITSYTYSDSKMTGVNKNNSQQEVCAYTSVAELLTANGREKIQYTSDGRVAKISQQDNSFVKYAYDDSFVNGSTPGRVLIEDSRGVSLYVNYADGFTVGERPNEYDLNAVYDPENISDVIRESTLLPLCYGIGGVEIQMPEDSFDDQPLYVELGDETYLYMEYINDKPTGIVLVSECIYDSYLVAQAAAEKKIEIEYIGDEIETVSFFEKVEGVWCARIKLSYTYNEYDLQSSASTFYFENGDWALKNRESYAYDSYGNVCETVSLVVDGTETQYTTNQTTYNAFNQVVLKEQYSGTALTSSTAYEYNSEGRVSKQTTDGKETKYTYDADGKITSYATEDDAVKITYVNGKIASLTDKDNVVYHYLYDDFGNLIAQNFDIYSLGYNTLGSLISAKVNSNDIVNYSYAGGAQDMTGAAFANGQDIAYEYVGGRLTSVKLGETEKYRYAYTLDTDGNVTETVISDLVSGQTKTITDTLTTVNQNGNTLYTVENKYFDESVENSFDGKVYTFGNTIYTLVSEDGYDIFTRSDSESEFGKEYIYDENYHLTETGIDGVFTSAFTYTDDALVSYLSHTFGNGILEYEYTYDGNGNILSENGTNYTYDEKNQLISADDGLTKWEYTYDSRGNILSKIKYQKTNSLLYGLQYSVSDRKTFTYANSDWEDELTSVNGKEITYDAAGNPISYLGHTLTWTMGRQLASFDDITYTYNEDGIRTSKTSNGITTKYYLDGTKIIAQTDGTEITYFRYDSNGELIGFIYNDNDYFYIKNQMQDIMGIVDAEGNLVVSYTYDPWGKPDSASGNHELIQVNPFRYRSYYYDSDIGMYYLQSRYYDPGICRFINADMVEYSIQCTNLFQYCINNPIACYDSTGKSVESKTLSTLETKVTIIFCYLIAAQLNMDEKEIQNITSELDNDWSLILYVFLVIYNGNYCAYEVRGRAVPMTYEYLKGKTYDETSNIPDGIRIPVSIAFLNKSICQIVAKYYIELAKYISDYPSSILKKNASIQKEIAKEIYGHSYGYYFLISDKYSEISNKIDITNVVLKMDKDEAINHLKIIDLFGEREDTKEKMYLALFDIVWAGGPFVDFIWR